jgi:hypothetical protein
MHHLFEVLKHAFLHWSNMALAQAFESWIYYAEECARQFNLMKKAVLCLVHRELSKAVNTWRDAAAQRSIILECLASAIHQWTNWKQACAFRSLLEAARLARVAQYAILKMRYSIMVKALNKWIHVNQSLARNAKHRWNIALVTG